VHPTLITISDVELDLINPNPDDIKLYDIVHGLSHINRYFGQTIIPFSVAHHTLAIMVYLQEIDAPVAVRQAALIHDFAEFALGDVIAPLKSIIAPPGSFYEVLTLRWEDAICQRFKCGTGESYRAIFKQHVHDIDQMAHRAEADLFTAHKITDRAPKDMELAVGAVQYLGPMAVRNQLIQEAGRYLAP